MAPSREVTVARLPVQPPGQLFVADVDRFCLIAQHFVAAKRTGAVVKMTAPQTVLLVVQLGTFLLGTAGHPALAHDLLVLTVVRRVSLELSPLFLLFGVP